MYTTHDVMRLVWPRQNGRQFRVQAANFKRLKKHFPRFASEKKVETVCKQGSYFIIMQKSPIQKFRFSNTLIVYFSLTMILNNVVIF